MVRWRILITLCIVFSAGWKFAQQSAPGKPNELLAARLVYVAPMPAGIDQWIQENLQRWGKYQVTANPEGVDLVVRAIKPEKEQELEMRGGVPQPKGTGRRLPVPLPRRGRQELPVISFSVLDWVTNQELWHADVLDRKQKKDEPDPPAGPLTRIYARGFTSDQLAMKVTTKLREYVRGLEKAPVTSAPRETPPSGTASAKPDY